MNKPFLKLNNGSIWLFNWNEKLNRWTHKARKYTYGIFIDCIDDREHDWQTPMVWIGQLVEHNDRNSWITVEKEIGADELHIDRGIIKFVI